MAANGRSGCDWETLQCSTSGYYINDLSDLFILDPCQGNKKEQCTGTPFRIHLYCEMQPYSDSNGKSCRFRILHW